MSYHFSTTNLALHQTIFDVLLNRVFCILDGAGGCIIAFLQTLRLQLHPLRLQLYPFLKAFSEKGCWIPWYSCLYRSGGMDEAVEKPRSWVRGEYLGAGWAE